MSSNVANTVPTGLTAAQISKPDLPSGLTIVDVPLLEASEDNLSLVGASLISSPDERSVANRNFQIVAWPVQGWRQLDSNTGDEAGTTEGPFEVHWEGDYFFGHNLGVATSNNYYLDGLSAPPEIAQHIPGQDLPPNGADSIYLWMSDYHPDGAQMFWNHNNVPFTVCLGPASVGDDVQPTDMRAYSIPPGKGVYFPAGTWHNGVYTHASFGKQTFLTRQGKVHARVSCSWAAEYKVLLKAPLCK
jgi:ureidoglycolate lyase